MSSAEAPRNDDTAAERPRREDEQPAASGADPPSRRARFGKDMTAGLTGAVGGVPDGLAAGTLAGVNPVFGLYAAMVAPIAGGLLSSTRLMVVTATSAGALLAADALNGLSGTERAQAIVVLTVLVGLVQLAAGVLRLGRLTHFVSHAVMTGFLTAIAVLIVLSQLSTLVGYDPDHGNAVRNVLDVTTHLVEANPGSVITGGTAIALMLLLGRTRLRSARALVAVVIPSALVALVGWDQVQLVGDVGEVPAGLPRPALPSLSLVSWSLTSGALAIAAIMLVQGAGVGETVPNPGGRRSNLSRDFLAQGVANLAAGAVRGIPVGGSLSLTALSVTAGAASRWAPVLQGLWIILIVLLFSRLIAVVAMPALAALLILAGLSTLKPGEIVAVWHAGWPSALAMLATFVAMLALPIAAAVGIGVALSALLHLGRSAVDVSVYELVRRGDGEVEARDPPERLPSDAVTILQVQGSLFYAGARTFERRLPDVNGAREPIVVLRLRGHTKIGSTFAHVLKGFADELETAGGRLYLTGVDEPARRHLEHLADAGGHGPIAVYPAESVIGRSTLEAVHDAERWLVRGRRGAATGGEAGSE